jgi:hypothetical protein
MRALSSSVRARRRKSSSRKDSSPRAMAQWWFARKRGFKSGESTRNSGFRAAIFQS